MKKSTIICLTALAAISSGCLPPENTSAKNLPANTPANITSETKTPAPVNTPASTPAVTPSKAPTPTPLPQTPTPAPTPLPTPTPVPTPPPTPKPEPVEVISPYPSNYSSAAGSNNALSNKSLSWYYNPNTSHQPPTAQRDFDIKQFDAYYLGDINSKTVYLTFDLGYENGYTATILDVLKEKGVHAAFFVEMSYVKRNIDLVNRMIDEGHIVANHSATHPEVISSLTDEEVEYQILETARYFKEATGIEMHKYFRPPKGEYSARTLALTQKLGYKTIFWSFAYVDWDREKQPGKDYAYKRVMDYTHPGCIYLLHGVSQSNTEALPDILDSLKEQGYQFKSLDDLP